MTKELEKVYARIADLALYALEAQAEKLGIKNDTPEYIALCEVLTARDYEEVNMNSYSAWNKFFISVVQFDNKRQEEINNV